MTRREGNRGTWRRFINLYRNIRIPWPLYAASLLLGLVAAQLAVWLAPYTAKVTQGRFESNDLVPMFLLITLLGVIVAAVRGISDLFAQARVGRNLQSKVWERLLGAPLSEFNRAHRSDLVARVTVDPLDAGSTLYAVTSVWTALYGFVAALGAMATASAALTVLFLLMIPVTAVVFWLVGLTQFLAQRTLVRAWGTMTGFFAEHLGMFKSMKLLSAEHDEVLAGRRQIDTMFRAGLVVVGYAQIQALLGSVITNSSVVLIFVGGAAFVRDGQLSQDDLVLLYSLIGVAMPFLFEILTQYTMVKGTQGFTEKIGHVLELPQERPEEGVAAPAEPSDIRFDSVSFAYDGEPVLRDVSLVIPAGKTTAIVGANGCGKSTILRLLQGVYPPDAGAILVGDIPLSRIRPESWRRSVATVAQDPEVLSGTVGQNVSFSDLEAPMDRVIAAATVAHADEFITAHPDGYALQVGEGGEKLSGGQRQRVAIARALLPDPDYLILDEASSALDRQTDASVDASVKAAMEGRTVVVVSHRLSTVEDADQIIVIDNGQVQAAGTHEEILRNCALYRNLIAAENARFPQ